LKTIHLYLLAAFSGALLAMSFPPMPFNLLAFIGFTPLLIALDHKPKHPFLLIYLAFFIYHGGTNWWIIGWQPEADPFLIVAGVATWLVHPFLFMIPMGLYLIISRKIGNDIALWYFPFIWVFFEWLHSLGDLAYPWLSIGYSQITSIAWAQFADITGVWGLSMVVVFLNIIFYKIILQIRMQKSTGGKIKISPLLIVAHLTLFFLPLVYGVSVKDDHEHENDLKNNPSMRIALIQPNINPWLKWENSVLGQIQQHIHIQDSLKNVYGGLDLGIWSETAIGYYSYNMNVNHNFAFLQNWVDTSNVALMTGFADIFIYPTSDESSVTAKDFLGDSSRKYDSYNSALLLLPNKAEEYQIYHKMKLTPFSERIPYIQQLPFMRDWFEWGVGISSWAPGESLENLKIVKGNDTIKIAPIICIESIFPGFVAKFVSKGAGIISIITNDAWFDHTFGPTQHYDIARMRAIETRRYVARCANTGVSGFIKPNGEDLIKLNQYVSTGLVADVPVLSDITFYVKYGDYICYISAFIVLIGLLHSFIIGKNKMGRMG
jgi:apolipoprotein N-acyltransferase